MQQQDCYTDTNGNQAAIAYISTGFATITFIGIILCNIYTAIRRIPQLQEITLQRLFQRGMAENDGALEL